jgi:hypothetical protein
MNFVSGNRPFFTMIIPLTLILFMMVNFVWPDDGIRKTTIDGDGRGHYVYLPLIFIEHDYDFTKIFEKEKQERQGFIGHNFHKVNGVYINKFPIGTAVLISPFFLAAHLTAKLTGYPTDGFSLPYQYGTALAALFWLLTGLWFLSKLLRLYNIPEKIIFWVLIFIVTSTNLFHYAFLEVSLSHVYSFSLITIFLFFTRKLFNKFHISNLLLSAFSLGLVILVRQVNLLVIIAIPFLAGNRDNLMNTIIILFSSRGKYLLLYILTLTAALLPQIIINLLQTGKPYVYGYQNEGFNFLSLQTFKFLFSFQKGWFIYTPAMLLIIPATISLYRSSKYRFAAFIFFMVILIYIFSSWWNWFFGDSFGMRPMVDYYSLFVIVISLWIKDLKRRSQKLIFILLVLFSALNIVQSYQYSKGIIHVDSMDLNAYKYIFLKTSDKYRNAIGPDEEYFYGELSEPLVIARSDLATIKNGWRNPQKNILKKDKNRELYEPLNDQTVYGPSYTFIADKNMSNKKLYLKLSAEFIEKDTNAAKKAFYIVDIKDTGNKQVFYKGFLLKKIPDDITGKKVTGKTGIKLPPLRPGYRVKTYVWNNGKKKLSLYSYTVSVHEILPKR